MGALLIRRALGVVGVAAALMLFTFIATHSVGDPIGLMIDPETSSPEEIAEIREASGLNDPVWQQFLSYAGGVLRGDFGISLWQNRPASEIVLDRLPATIELAVTTVLFSVAVGIGLALLAVWKRGTLIESTISLVSTALACIPSFWLALVLMLAFAVRLAWLPTSGYGSWRNFVLPVLALSAQPIGMLTQVIHTSLLNETGQPYVRVARAKGLTERALLTRHVFRNSAVLVFTMVASMLAMLLNGAVLAEAVFAWPGVGDLGLQAVRQRDLPVLTAVVFYAGITVALINLLVDLVYSWLDPRVTLK